jgi:hypothetical protein
MDPVGVLEHDQTRVVVEADAEFLAGGMPVGEQAHVEGWISSGASNHAGTKCWRSGVKHFDLTAELTGTDQPTFEQQLSHGGLHDLEIAMPTRLIGRGVMLAVVIHPHVLSNQSSNISIRKLS